MVESNKSAVCCFACVLPAVLLLFFVVVVVVVVVVVDVVFVVATAAAAAAVVVVRHRSRGSRRRCRHCCRCFHLSSVQHVCCSSQCFYSSVHSKALRLLLVLMSFVCAGDANGFTPLHSSRRYLLKHVSLPLLLLALLLLCYNVRLLCAYRFFSFGVYKLLWDLPCISNETAAAKYFVQNIDVKTWRSPPCDPISTDPILMHCGVCFFLFRAKNFSSINHPLDISSLVYVLLSPHPFRIVSVWLAKSSGRKLVTALTAVFLQTHNSFRTQM